MQEPFEELPRIPLQELQTLTEDQLEEDPAVIIDLLKVARAVLAYHHPLLHIDQAEMVTGFKYLGFFAFHDPNNQETEHIVAVGDVPPIILELPKNSSELEVVKAWVEKVESPETPIHYAPHYKPMERDQEIDDLIASRVEIVKRTWQLPD